MQDKLHADDYSLLQSALDVLDGAIENEAGNPTMEQIGIAVAKAEGNADKAKQIVDEMMKEELALARAKRRDIALLRAKLYQIEAQEDASDVIEEARAVLGGGEA